MKSNQTLQPQAGETLENMLSLPNTEALCQASVLDQSTESSTLELAEIAGFDEAQLRESLTAVSSDPKEALSLLLETYLADADSLLTQIRKSIETVDFETLRFASHTLKSSSALMGIMKLSELCRQLEHCAREQNQDSLTSLLEQAETVQSQSQKLLLSYQPS